MELRQEAEDATDAEHIQQLRVANGARQNAAIMQIAEGFRRRDWERLHALVNELTYWNKVDEVLQAKA
jgi:DnaJ-domain-containing protein 1